MDGQAYLEANPDVADAVENGDFDSAEQHYEMFGQDEGRALEPDDGTAMELGDEIVGTSFIDNFNAATDEVQMPDGQWQLTDSHNWLVDGDQEVSLSFAQGDQEMELEFDEPLGIDGDTDDGVELVADMVDNGALSGDFVGIEG